MGAVRTFPRPGRDRRRGAARRALPWAFCVALALAGPAAAGPFEDLAPCMSTQHGLDGLAAAFLADGWALAADGADGDRVARATAEINWALRTSPGRFRSPEQAADFLATAHRSHGQRTDPFVLLMRGDRGLILEWSTNGSRGQNICLMAAPEIDYVGAGMPPAAVDPDQGRHFAAIEVPMLRAAPNIRAVHAVLVRLRVPEAAGAGLAGGDGVLMSVTYKWQ